MAEVKLLVHLVRSEYIDRVLRIAQCTNGENSWVHTILSRLNVIARDLHFTIRGHAVFFWIRSTAVRFNIYSFPREFPRNLMSNCELIGRNGGRESHDYEEDLRIIYLPVHWNFLFHQYSNPTVPITYSTQQTSILVSTLCINKKRTHIKMCFKRNPRNISLKSIYHRIGWCPLSNDTLIINLLSQMMELHVDLFFCRGSKSVLYQIEAQL